MKKDKRVGSRFDDVIGASLEINDQGRPQISLAKMDSFEGRYGYSGTNIGCDVLDGPCSCGVYHHMDWKKCRGKMMQGYTSILTKLDETLHSEGNTPLSLQCSVVLVVHQRQPSLEMHINSLLEQKEVDKIAYVIGEVAQKHGLRIVGLGEKSDLNYQLEPDYKNKKREFGFLH